MTKNGNVYTLVISDCFTKWKEAFPIRDHTALTVADTLVTSFICHYGCPVQINRTLRQMLIIFMSENFDDWDDLLPYLLMAYRTTEHKRTKCSPNLMTLGRETHFPFDLIVGKSPNAPTENCRVKYVQWLQ